MKKFIWIYILGVYFLLFASCERHDLHTISGYLYEDCSMTPVPNQYVELIQGITGGLGQTDGGFLISGYTDDNGYFELVFDSQNNQTIKLMDESIELILDIPCNEDTKDVVAYRQPTCNIHLTLNVINPYTEEDTLYITNFNDLFNKLVIPGPFESGVLYIAENFPILELSYNANMIDMAFAITETTEQDDWTILPIDLKACDTNYVTVDIY